ncbi:MAG: DUF4843 domain-containing protein [Mongoliitalea sp.]
MKRIVSVFSMVVALFFSSCLEQDLALWDGSLVEWDATVVNNPAAGRTYPLLARQPRPLFPLVTTGAAADPLITRASGTVTLRVNFVAPQRANDETITYRVVEDESTAVAGTHFNATGTAVIPANSSFADVTIQILDPGATSGSRVLVLELEGNNTIQPSERYKKVGISIAQN